MPITVQDLVNREVHYCVSALVSTLASGNGVGPDMVGDELAELTEQAAELCYPLEDWEEAAIQGGWYRETSDALWLNRDGREADFTAETAQEACEIDDLTPFDREVFEHWIVSDWLADRLAEKGEKIDKDFAGMIVWARTTTGQGVASDSVIEAIHAGLVK